MVFLDGFYDGIRKLYDEEGLLPPPRGTLHWSEALEPARDKWKSI